MKNEFELPTHSALMWRPIETAPKDGTRVLFAGTWLPFDIHKGGGPQISIASWSTFMSDGTGHQWIIDGALGSSGLDGWNVKWTHWLPLPEPPH